MTRKQILESAQKCVCEDREAEYGTPESNFKLIAELWMIYIRAKYGFDLYLSADDVAMMMALVKVARIATGSPKADSYADLAGYAALAGELGTGGAENDRN